VQIGGVVLVNLILKFMKNPKRDGKLVSFFRKKICFILQSTTEKVQDNEFWECFLWADRGKFFLVKPFKKIEESKVKEEQARIDAFNQDLLTLERYKSPDFDKVVFDENNRPFLLANKSRKIIEEKYDDYVVKIVNKQVWVRPILNEQDRKDYQMQAR